MKKFPGFPKEPATNYWPYPKALNGWWHLLTGSEQKTLDYILRHTWGFKKTSDKIAYKQFINGVKNCDKGCGIKSSATLSKALNGLARKGFITIKGGQKTGKLNVYSLTFGGAEPLQKLKRGSLETKEVTSLETKDTIKDKTIKDINNIHEQKDVRVKVYKRLPKERQTIVHRLCYHLEDILDTKIVNWGKQGAAIKRMMRVGYTEDEIKRAITYMAKGDPFFEDKGFDLVTVSNAIPRYKGKASAMRRNHV